MWDEWMRASNCTPSNAYLHFRTCSIHRASNPEATPFMHSPGVRKFSHCHSRTALSNTIASIHTWLFKFKLITTSKSWESVKELGGNITLLCVPAHHTVTDNCSHGQEKGLGWQDSGFWGSSQTRKAFSLLGVSPVFPPPIRMGSRYRLMNGGPASNTAG